ncbi:MAG: hypothetical protein RLZZ591_50 [Pseudomonadota bacterium]
MHRPVSALVAFAATALRSWLVQLCFLVLLAPIQTWAQDLIFERAWLDDPQAVLSLEEVQKREFSPYQGLLSKGYGSSAIWLRLRIDPARNVAAGQLKSEMDKNLSQTVVLRLRPPLLDDVALFDPLSPRTEPRVTGDHHPLSADEYPSLDFGFVVPLGDEPRDLWLRLQSTSTRLLDVEALTLAQARQADTRQHMLYGIYMGVVILFVGWALVNLLIAPEKLLAVFFVKQLFAVLFALVLLGYLRFLNQDWLAPKLLDTLSNLIIVTFVPLSVYFDYLLLREYEPPRWTLRVLQGAVFLFPVDVLLVLSGHTMQALRIQMALVVALPVFGLITASLATYPKVSDPASSHRLPKPMLVGAYSLILLALLCSSLPSLGWVQATESALLTTLVYGVLSGVVMVGLLQLRSRRLAQGHASLQTELALVERQAMHERDRVQDQQKMMSMLGHELKTPLAVVSMLVTTPEALTPQKISLIRNSVGDMNNVIERTTLSGALEGKRLSAHHAACDAATEIERLCKQHPQVGRLQLQLEAHESMESDVHLLRLVLGNLIDNACRHSAPDSAVTVSLSSQMRGELPGVQIMVSNLPGRSGWPDPERIFQKFYRHDHARHQTGAGLGMYVSRGLAHLLDGQLDYRPSPSHIRFALWLPL